MTPDSSTSWVIGGPQGSGVDSAASMMGRACAAAGLWVFGKREYHSNIMGLHSYFQFRVSDRPVHSHVDRIDVLVTFEEETLVRHANAVRAGGGIVYDPGKVSKPLVEIRSFHGRAADATRARLVEAGLEPTVSGILKEAEGRGVHLYPFPYSEVMSRFAQQHTGIPAGRLARATNTAAVAASFAVLDLDPVHLERAVRSTFAAKPPIAELNAEYARFAFSSAKERITQPLAFGPVSGASHGKLFLTGTQAVAIGKLLGGCRFQTYYPITPASDESEFLEAHEVFSVARPGGTNAPAGIVVVQTEDEIAAVTMAAGASLTGARAATSTSGPGFSLMAEGLGFAGINEIPLVVTLYQRAGPSTGLPTRHEQGDLRFAIHAGHGEFPRIVVASGDAEECIFDAVRSLNYAARYQMPVIHLVDKALANSTSIVPFPEPEALRLDTGVLAAGAEPDGGYLAYRRFAPAPQGISPRAPLGTPGVVSWHTGDEHNEVGHIDEDPENRKIMMEKRAAKLDAAAREIPEAEQVAYYGPPDVESVVVSWGSTKGAIRDAQARLVEEGRNLGFLQVRLLHPFPARAVAAVLARARRKIVLEMNFSAQLAGMIAEATQLRFDTTIVKFNGRPFSEEEVHDGLARAMEPEPPERMVMTHGA